jgi:hypothetical protein
VEFYISYFDLVANDLLEAIEEACLKGEVNRSLNSTFIALIPKVNGPATFGDFRPIALCNLCYKIILKLLPIESDRSCPHSFRGAVQVLERKTDHRCNRNYPRVPT